jgi:hypothetical protein
MSGFSRLALVGLALCLLQAQGFGQERLVPPQAPADKTPRTELEAPGNRLMFSPKPRTQVLPTGSQNLLGAVAVGIVLIGGLTQLRSWRGLGGASLLLVGCCLFYGAWVFHKWTISGAFPIFQGHMVTWAAGAVGVAVGLLGIFSLARERSEKNYPKLSKKWVLLASIWLTLGVATGTAFIFEATPALYGIDPPLEKILVQTAIGSAISASSILLFARAACRMV